MLADVSSRRLSGNVAPRLLLVRRWCVARDVLLRPKRAINDNAPRSERQNNVSISVPRTLFLLFSTHTCTIEYGQSPISKMVSLIIF